MAKFCTNCGAPMEEGQNACTSCGNVVGTVQANQSTTQRTAAPGAKSKLAAGLLGIFLGAYGVHNFYLGYTGKGIAQIFVTIFTCGIGGLWGFIEGILILTGSINTDAQGNPLTD